MVSSSKLSLLSLMHFPIFLCHDFMHCWKDSSGMSFSSVKRALLMSSTFLKRVFLLIILSFEKKGHSELDPGTREIIPVQQFSSMPGTAGCSGHYWQVHCHDEVATICPVTNLISSHRLNKHIDLLIDCLPCVKKLLLMMPFTLMNMINMTLTFDFDYLAFFSLCNFGDFQ